MRQEIINVLLERNIVQKNKMDDIINVSKEQGVSVEQYLIKNELIEEEDLAKLKGEIYNIDYVNLFDVKILTKVINIIPSETAKLYEIIVFDLVDNLLKVGIVDPKNFKAIEAVEFLAKKMNFEVEYNIISRNSLEIAFKHYYKMTEEIGEVLDSAKDRLVDTKGEDGDEEDLEYVVKSAPVSKIVSVIMKHAVNAGASDIHIEPNNKGTKVRYRIDGVLRTVLNLPSYVHSALVSRVKVLANLKLDETRIPQDGRIRINVGNEEIDLRISTLPLLENEKVVARILKNSNDVLTLEQLGYRKKYVEMINNSLSRAHGLILVTGPTGSGKSTTLNSILSLINSEDVNIVTLEDPAEYHLEGVNQSQVNSEVGYTFASGLRAILRQDPNVLMVGEIRDLETATLVTHAALTGHVVFSTLHTRNAKGALHRLTDIGIEPFLTGATIEQVIAQRLVRVLCPHCKEEITLSKPLEKDIRKELSQIPEGYLTDIKLDPKSIKVYRSKGCSKCNNMGYKGRSCIAEIINFDEALKYEITKGWKESEISALLKKRGFISMKQDGFLKVLEGITSIEEVLRVMKT